MNQEQKQLNLARLLAYDREMQDLILVELHDLLSYYQDSSPTEISENQLIDDLYENIWAAVLEDDAYNEESNLLTKIQLAIPNRNSPFGYRILSHHGKITLVPDPLESRIVELVYYWYLQHHFSLRDIANQLTALRLPTRATTHMYQDKKLENGSWDMTIIHSMVTSRTYIGEWQHYDAYHKQSSTISVPPIISADLYQKAQAQLRKNLNRPQHALKYPYLLPFRVTCGVCDSPIQLHAKKLPDGICQYYRCPTRKCDTRGFRSSIVDTLVWAWLVNQLENPESRRVLQEGMQNNLDLQTFDKSLQIQIVEGYLERYRKQFEQLSAVQIPNNLIHKPIQQVSAQLQSIISNLEASLTTMKNEMPEQIPDIFALDISQTDLQLRQKIVELLDVKAVICGRNKNRKIHIYSKIGNATLNYIGGMTNE